MDKKEKELRKAIRIVAKGFAEGLFANIDREYNLTNKQKKK